ncbi:penicillin acylase family protein [Paucibacter sp. Y2R2-4]|uniref:penicillin acylase family protein n=1 Tax=Paucibacter sp. Y2R2-4 TaxID=2893553 RepID=UPI0021E48036|nr:penicillin acylase family protein [Paucibacter sp. Y2R2-4]MCV2350723.1 penicillin acylase family protein [Paucibacter sp. Y2R2-4]
MSKPSKVKKWALRSGVVLLVSAGVLAAAVTWHLRSLRPLRSGDLPLQGLQAAVSVRYDEWGVPHIEAQNEADLYRALGYVHAQDRLFQMEMLRRLSRGELAAILGPKLVETDRLFRTLGIRAHADAYVAREFAAADTPAKQALLAYLDGVNQYQATRPAPLEFEILGIPKRPFTPADTVSIGGYLAYSFAAGFRTEPALTQIRDQLGPTYLKIFDEAWRPDGVLRQNLRPGDWQDLGRLAQLSHSALELAGQPLFEGSNAWAVSGARTASGKPLLAGDPHIQFATPAVWYEAHLKAPGFELYGHHQALNPLALLGHNQQFAWSLTMFQNDDVDLVAEKLNPANPNEVWRKTASGGEWVALQSREETIEVKGAAQLSLKLRRSPHGPIINDALAGAVGETPIALWWGFLETENPVLEAFYALNRADTLSSARKAVSQIHAPGLNVVWANAAGDIGWWAAAKLPIRPKGVNPNLILDGASGEAEKLGWLPFEKNPQEENPARGYILSANHQPAAAEPVPGYYNLWDRAERLDSLLRDPSIKWAPANTRALQLDVQNGYSARVLKPLLPLLQAAAKSEEDRTLIAELAAWSGAYSSEARAPVLFQQFLFELTRLALQDEVGEKTFNNLRLTRALDHALPRLMADPSSPWWDKRGTPEVETQAQLVAEAWGLTLAHLRTALGSDSKQWRWGFAHTVTHGHPLGLQKPLDKIFNVGPFAAPGSHETPNNMAARIGPAPWAVVYGPSTRRIIDLAAPAKGLGINPVGQSGVYGDPHYADQALMHAAGQYRQQYLAAEDVQAHTRSTLTLKPAAAK